MHHSLRRLMVNSLVLPNILSVFKFPYIVRVLGLKQGQHIAFGWISLFRILNLFYNLFIDEDLFVL